MIRCRGLSLFQVPYYYCTRDVKETQKGRQEKQSAFSAHGWKCKVKGKRDIMGVILLCLTAIESLIYSGDKL